MVDAHRPLDVLNPLLAREDEAAAQLALEVVVGGPRDRGATRGRELLEAGGDVHPVAEQVPTLDDHVAKVDPNPEHYPPLGLHLGLPQPDASLHRDGTGHGVHHRAELHDGTVAHELDDAALVLGQEWIDHLPP